MKTPARLCLAAALVLAGSAGCKSSAIDDSSSEPGPDGGEGLALAVQLGPEQRTFVELGTPALVDLDGDGRASIAWDLAFQGRDVFTNGGISGPGNSGAFGPLAAPTFLSDTAPETPLLLKDRAGGALLDWYDYGGATHQLFSRFHVYALRDGERLFKLQILSYYGEQLGAPVAALYHVRYAEVTASGPGETHEVAGIDATAGGSPDDDEEPSGCLDLDSEKVTPLTPKEAAASDAWQLCFRREGIAVNGGLSGPRGVVAVDLQADAIAEETEEAIQRRTAESEASLFEQQDFESLSDPALTYRADGVVTAFGQRWLESDADPLALSDTVWLVVGADGGSKYLVRLSELTGDPAVEQASLLLEAKAVR